MYNCGLFIMDDWFLIFVIFDLINNMDYFSANYRKLFKNIDTYHWNKMQSVQLIFRHIS